MRRSFFKQWGLPFWGLFYGFCYCLIGYAASPPHVVVTLKPIHSLVASIMEGVGEPDLLVPDGASPHTFLLKPSTLRQIQKADLVIWVGPELELFLIKTLQQRPVQSGIITLQDTPSLRTYPLRHGQEWQSDHTHDHDDEHAIDPHFWLSTENAQRMVSYITQQLSKIDVEHAKIYQQNAQVLQKKIRILHSSLHTMLSTVQAEPFLVYHDGYQYFEQEFNLHAVGTMVVNPHVPLSAYGLRKIKQLIKTHHIHCVFRETEFNDTLIRNSLSELGITVAELDPLGARQPLGPLNYEKTLYQLGKTLSECLNQKRTANTE